MAANNANLALLRELVAQQRAQSAKLNQILDDCLGRLGAQLDVAEPESVLEMVQSGGLLPLLLDTHDLLSDEEDPPPGMVRVLLALGGKSKEVFCALYAFLKEGVVARRVSAMDCIAHLVSGDFDLGEFEDFMREVLGDGTLLQPLDVALLQAIAGNFGESSDHLDAASNVLYMIVRGHIGPNRTECVACVFEFLDSYVAAVCATAKDDACELLEALAELEPMTVWQQPQFIDAIIGVLSSEQDDDFYVMMTLKNLAAVPEIAEAMRATPRLVAALCLPMVAEGDFYCCSCALFLNLPVDTSDGNEYVHRHRAAARRPLARAGELGGLDVDPASAGASRRLGRLPPDAAERGADERLRGHRAHRRQRRAGGQERGAGQGLVAAARPGLLGGGEGRGQEVPRHDDPLPALEGLAEDVGGVGVGERMGVEDGRAAQLRGLRGRLVADPEVRVLTSRGFEGKGRGWRQGIVLAFAF
jgi:hypothetical protein